MCEIYVHLHTKREPGSFQEYPRSVGHIARVRKKICRAALSLCVYQPFVLQGGNSEYARFCSSVYAK